MTSEQLRACLHPLRLRLLEAAARVPGSSLSLARRLGLPQPRVHYHLGILLRAGLLRLAEERRKRGTVEKLYAAEVEAWAEAERILAPRPEAAEGYAAFESRTLWLTRGQARRLHEGILRLLREPLDRGPGSGACRIELRITPAS